MGNFYLISENTVDLIITDVNFPVDHADYFNITIMNPSYSPSETSITEIYITVEGDNNIYNVTSTYPEELPITLEKATSKTIKCLRNWGKFAGKTVTVHVSAINASGATWSTKTEFVKLEIEAYFNATESCKHFNVTVKNHEESAINLTLTKVYFDYKQVENMSIQIPPSGLIIPRNETIEFQCFVDWQGHEEPYVKVETLEGYIAEVRKEAPSVVTFEVINVKFNETDPSEFSVSFFNSPNSATRIEITNIVLTYDNGTKYTINGNLTKPPSYLPYVLSINETVTFNCIWPWRNYRNRNVVITAYTKQGFTSIPKTIKTPQPVIFKMTKIDFNLTNTEYFLVNITNMACSLQDINITQIFFENNEITFEPQVIPIGEEAQFNCTFEWKNFRGKNATITVHTTDGLNVSKSITLPSVRLEVGTPVFNESPVGIPYVNITISNTVFSVQNVTVTKIILKTENATFIIDGTLTNPNLIPDGYFLPMSANVTITCPWNWRPYLGENVTVIVQTVEGFQTSEVFKVENSLL
jgi:hypothetical protein